MALADIRVIDLTDERGIYGTKLLADLGAQVIRPESATGDPLRQRHLSNHPQRTVGDTRNWGQPTAKEQQRCQRTH